MQLTAHQLLLFGGAGAERLLLGQRERWGPPPGSPILPPAPQPLTCPPGGDPEPLGERPRRARPASSVRSAVGVPSPRAVPPSGAPRAARGAGLAAGPARRGLSAARGAGAGAAGGGRRLHNPPGAARRFLSSEVRAARPAPAPGTGPSAAGGDRCWPGRAARGGHRGLTALERGLEGL